MELSLLWNSDKKAWGSCTTGRTGAGMYRSCTCRLLALRPLPLLPLAAEAALLLELLRLQERLLELEDEEELMVGDGEM